MSTTSGVWIRSTSVAILSIVYSTFHCVISWRALWLFPVLDLQLDIHCVCCWGLCSPAPYLSRHSPTIPFLVVFACVMVGSLHSSGYHRLGLLNFIPFTLEWHVVISIPFSAHPYPVFFLPYSRPFFHPLLLLHCYWLSGQSLLRLQLPNHQKPKCTRSARKQLVLSVRGSVSALCRIF